MTAKGIAMSKYKHLSLDERLLLSFYKEQGLFQNEIARLMKRSESTISRELKRNSNQNGYVAATAQKRSLTRCAQISRIDQNLLLEQFIIERLQENWTPEQISGRLRAFPEKDIPYVNDESIYQWLYKPAQKGEICTNCYPKHIIDEADVCVSIVPEFPTEFQFTNALKTLLREMRWGIGKLI
jgi:IS30 family transposase